MKINSTENLDPRIIAHFKGGKTLVDLGCGSGQVLDELSSLYDTAVGIDVYSTRFKQRVEAPVSWNFMLADLNEGIPLRGNSVDAVLANQVIEHIRDPKFFVSEIYRVLRPDGRVLLSTPNIRYLKHLWRLVGKGRGPKTAGDNTLDGSWDDGHIHYFTHRDLYRVFMDAGFQSVLSQALVGQNQGFRRIRGLLDHFAYSSIVKEFLSGNIMVTARK